MIVTAEPVANEPVATQRVKNTRDADTPTAHAPPETQKKTAKTDPVGPGVAAGRSEQPSCELHVGNAAQASVSATAQFETEPVVFDNVSIPQVAAEDPLTVEVPTGWLAAIMRLPKINRLTPDERARILRKNRFFVPPPESGPGNTFGNYVAITLVSSLSRILIRGLNRFHGYRMEVLYNAIESREKGRGLLTVSNHRSVLDDPVMLGSILPPRIILQPRLMRWGLCSIDICFQNSLASRFITMGKALPIMRSAGIGQPHLRSAAEKIVRGDWLHIYPEGRTCPHEMGYMKRGVGKVLAIAYEQCGGLKGLPVVLPIYHEGVENVMPQDKETHKLLRRGRPQIGHDLFAIAGDPVDVRDIFERDMPACAKAGGTAKDPAECVRLYENLADRLTLSVRLLRAELRKRVRREQGHFLGDPLEIS